MQTRTSVCRFGVSRHGVSQKAVRRAAACAALCTLVSYAHGQIVYEPFDIAAGSLGGNTNGMTGVKWVYGATTSQDIQTLAQNIPTDTNLAQPIAGNDLNVRGRDTSGNQFASVERLGLSDYSSGDLYLSCRLTVTDTTDTVSNGVGAFFTGFAPTPGNNTTGVTFAGARVRLQKSPTDPTKFQVGIQNDVNNTATFAIGTANTVFSSTNFPLNTPILIVARYSFNPGALSNDVTTVWASPDSSNYGAPQAPAGDASSTGCDTIIAGDTIPTIRDIFFRQNPSGPNSMAVDDLRVGNTWASVTPKSGSTWSGASGNTWGGSNWTPAVPDAANAFAYFDDTSAVHNVTVDGTRTLGTMFITSSAGYNLSGGTLVFDGGMGTTVHGSSAINVNAIKDAAFANILTANSTIGSAVTLNNDLYASIGAGQTLTLSGNIKQSTSSALIKNGGGTLVLSGTNSYSGVTGLYDGTLAVSSNALAASSSITFDGGVLKANGNLALGASVQLIANGMIDSGANTVNLSGVISNPVLTQGLTKLGTGTLILSGINTYTGATTVNGGTVVLSKDAQTPVLSGQGAVINAGRLILDYSNGGTDPTSTIVPVLAANLSNNNTAGLVRTGNTADPNRGIGYRDDLGGSRLILRYTYRGDANLDGVVNALDFNAVATNFGSSTGVWEQGDFNYDGKVDASDFTYLGATFGSAALASTLPAGSLGTLVPEPVSASIFCSAILLPMRRRARRR